MLSGGVNGLLSAYDFNLYGSGGKLSGSLVYGDMRITDCTGPGCTITGFYATPEPDSIAMIGAGLLRLAVVRRRQASQNSSLSA